MANTAAERQRKRRAWLKQPENIEEYLRLKQRDRERKLQAKQALSQAEKQALKRKEAAASRRYRAKQMQQNDVSSPAYLTPQAIGRAKRRVMKHLPKSPRKKKAVVRKLAKEILNVDFVKDHQNRSTRALSEDVREKVIAIYHREARMMPGKADTITIVNDNGSKEVRQREHMVMTVDELYALFKDEYPGEVIGRSKFTYLRPKEVLLCSQTPRNTCGCVYHSNIFLLLETLHGHTKEIPLYKRNDLLPLCVCDQLNEECMCSECDVCSDGKLLVIFFNDSVSEERRADLVKLYQWVSEDGYTTKKEEKITVTNVFEKLLSQLPRFLWHTFVKEKQSTAYEMQKEACMKADAEETVVQMDFSENFSCMFQDEVQSAHWQQKAVSIFTVMLYHRNQKLSWVMLTDSLTHDKKAVAAFSQEIVTHIVDTMPSVKTVNFWTDGPSSQFKNRFIMVLMARLQALHNVAITWSYFSTSHGKGPCDSGGRVKRLVSRQVLARTAIVQNASQFAITLAKVSDIKNSTLSEEEIHETCTALELFELWDNAPVIPGMMNTHHATINQELCIEISYYKGAPTKCHRLFDDRILQAWKNDRMNYEANNENARESHNVQENDNESYDESVTFAKKLIDMIEAEAHEENSSDSPEIVNVNENNDNLPGDANQEPSGEASNADTENENVANRETSPEHGKTKRKKKGKTFVKGKRKRASMENSQWHCYACNMVYGDKKDPKKTEDWLTCSKCQHHYHESCAELDGVLDDQDMFECKTCM